MDAITITNLRKRYDKLQAVKGISFSVKKGELFGFLGPNGAGKTTTINCITQLSTITSGKISVLGKDVIKEYNEAKMLIGLSPQEPAFDYYFPLIDVLTYQGGYYGMPWKEARKRAKELLKKFHLADKEKATAREISGGMKRRLSIAKALMHSPKILILDEPTAGLDVDARFELWDLIRELQKEGMTIILTTHYIEEAEKLCERIGIMNHGKLVKLEKTKKLLDDLSRNIIRFHLKEHVALPEVVRKHEFNYQDKVLEVFVAQKNQNTVLRELLRLFESSKIPVENFTIEHDTLENIFRRIVNGK
ncbi:MAG: ABC transporter ATP-binding protein [Candidatus Woesearchaeota archaeon]